MEFDQLFATIITEKDNTTKYDPQELAMGVKVESEHKDAYDTIYKFCESKGVKCPFTNVELYTMIAKAHLREFPKYYTALKQMEEQLKKGTAVKIVGEKKELNVKHIKHKKKKPSYKFNMETILGNAQNAY